MQTHITLESEFESSQAGTFAPYEARHLERYASVELAKGAVHSRYLSAGECIQITALNGAGWITLEGDPEDYVLETGTASVFSGPGLLVIEGLLEANCFIFYRL